MNANVSRVLAMPSQTVTRSTHRTIVSAAATRIPLLVLALLLYPSVTNAQIEWRISVKVFLDEFGQRLCLLEPDDCGYADCCYDSDEEIREMFEGPDSTLAFFKERGITFGEIEIVELEWGNLPEVPDGMDRYFGHYCREGADDDDGPCDPLADDPCWGSRVCVERPVDYYCDDDGHYLGPCDPNAGITLACAEGTSHEHYATMFTRTRTRARTIGSATIPRQSMSICSLHTSADDVNVIRGTDRIPELFSRSDMARTAPCHRTNWAISWGCATHTVARVVYAARRDVAVVRTMMNYAWSMPTVQMESAARARGTITWQIHYRIRGAGVKTVLPNTASVWTTTKRLPRSKSRWITSITTSCPTTGKRRQD